MRKACHKGAITRTKARGWDSSVLWDAGWVMGPQSFPGLIVCVLGGVLFGSRKLCCAIIHLRDSFQSRMEPRISH